MATTQHFTKPVRCAEVIDMPCTQFYVLLQAEAARRQKAEAEGRGARRKSVSERFVGEVNEAMKADGVGMAKRQKPVGQMLGFGDEFEPTNHDK